MRSRVIAATATLLLATLTACGSSDDSKPAAEGSPASETLTSEPTPDPTPSRQPILKMDSTWEFDGTLDGEDVQGSVTVIDYKQGIKSIADASEETGSDGYVWAYTELKTCSVIGSFLATTEPWTLAYEDGTRIEPSSSTWGDFPKPEYPFETKLTPGRCVRGKLVFPVPENDWPHTVVYAPYGIDTPQEWAVPTEG